MENLIFLFEIQVSYTELWPEKSSWPSEHSHGTTQVLKTNSPVKPPLVSVANLFCLAWTNVGPREVPLCHMHPCIPTDICWSIPELWRLCCRCWSIETGQCLKIFRGHTDTVMTVLVHNDVLASGAKDKSCKGETSPHAVSVPWLSLCRGWGLGGGGRGVVVEGVPSWNCPFYLCM